MFAWLFKRRAKIIVSLYSTSDRKLVAQFRPGSKINLKNWHIGSLWQDDGQWQISLGMETLLVWPDGTVSQGWDTREEHIRTVCHIRSDETLERCRLLFYPVESWKRYKDAPVYRELTIKVLRA